MSTLSTNAACNQIAQALTNVNPGYNTNEALNLISDIVVNSDASESVDFKFNSVKEEFIYPNGDTMQFLASAAGGGNSANVSATPMFDTSNLNWGGTIKFRAGVHQVSVNNAVASSYASLLHSSVIASKRYQLTTNGKFYWDAEWRAYSTPIINFANDPVLACVGLVDHTNTTTVNPLLGIYFRMPRLGETLFVKYVVRVAGVETVYDSDLPASNNQTGFLKTGMRWDGQQNRMDFYATDGVTVATHSIAGLTIAYPSLVSLIAHCGVYVARNGDGASKQTTGIQIDNFTRYIPGNYNNFL